MGQVVSAVDEEAFIPIQYPVHLLVKSARLQRGIIKWNGKKSPIAPLPIETEPWLTAIPSPLAVVPPSTTTSALSATWPLNTLYLNECGRVYAGVFSIPEAPILQSPSLKYRSGLRHQSYQRNARIAVADRMRGYLRYAS